MTDFDNFTEMSSMWLVEKHFFCVCMFQELNPEPHMCKASTTERHPQSSMSFIILNQLTVTCAKVAQSSTRAAADIISTQFKYILTLQQHLLFLIILHLLSPILINKILNVGPEQQLNRLRTCFACMWKAWVQPLMLGVASILLSQMTTQESAKKSNV